MSSGSGNCYNRTLLHHADVPSITVEPNNIVRSGNGQRLGSGGSNGGNNGNNNTGASRASSSTSGGWEEGQGDRDQQQVNQDLVTGCPHFITEVPLGWGQSPCSLRRIVSLTAELEEEDGWNNGDNNGGGGGEGEQESSLITSTDSLTPTYYKKYFVNRPHENYFAIVEDTSMGGGEGKNGSGGGSGSGWASCNSSPIAISIVKGEECWRLIWRSGEVGGDIRAEVGLDVGVIGKEVVGKVFPLIKELRLGSPASTTTLLKLDEQSTTHKHKVGILYCLPGQGSEEEMYNNQNGSREFEDFLTFLGDRVRLKGWTGYGGGLDCRDDTTGICSITNTRTFPGYQFMFHVSTLLPFTPANSQQLMRKRHIGNDIVTIIYQEPGCRPFNPRWIRSQFQHVFVVIRRVEGGAGGGGYRVAVSHSSSVPPFGPPLTLTSPTYQLNQEFLRFLLAKIVNGEHATYKSEKFVAMATRTRVAYLKDLYNQSQQGGGDGGGSGGGGGNSRFSLLSTIMMKKKSKAGLERSLSTATVPMPEGGLSWKLMEGSNPVYLVLSKYYLLLIEGKIVTFSLKTKEVVAWETDHDMGLTVYFHHNYLIASKTIPFFLDPSGWTQFSRKIRAHHPSIFETSRLIIRKRGGILGFHIQNDGLVTEVDIGSPAGDIGLCVGSRVVKINGRSTFHFPSSTQMIELLKGVKDSVELTVIHPISDNHLNSREENSVHSHPPQHHPPSSSSNYYCSPQDIYLSSSCSSSGYGTASSTRSSSSWGRKEIGNNNIGPPPPLPARRRPFSSVMMPRGTGGCGGGVGNILGFHRSSDNLNLIKINSEKDKNTRLSVLLRNTPRRQVARPQTMLASSLHPNPDFEEKLRKLINLEQPIYRPLSTSSCPVTPLRQQPHPPHPNTNISNNLDPSTSISLYDSCGNPALLESRVAALETQLAQEQKTKLELKQSLEYLVRENLKLQGELEVGVKREIERLKRRVLGE